MRSFWFDPYLWVHLAGLAVLPIALEFCLLGLAVGDPFLPKILEVSLVAIVGIVPILWMQWQKPFYIFSLLAIALQFEQLTLTQRQLLQRFKAPEIRVMSLLAAVGLASVLWQLYQLAPIAIEAADFLPRYRLLGLLLAAIGFLLSNLFLQVPVSVLLVMLTREASLEAIEPYPIEQIPQAFTVLGLRVKQILPQVAQPELAIAPPQTEPVTMPDTETPTPLVAEELVRPAIAVESAAPNTVSSGPVADEAAAIAEVVTLAAATDAEPVVAESVIDAAIDKSVVAEPVIESEAAAAEPALADSVSTDTESAMNDEIAPD